MFEVPVMETSVPLAFVHFCSLGFNYAVKEYLGKKGGERERKRERERERERPRADVVLFLPVRVGAWADV